MDEPKKETELSSETNKPTGSPAKPLDVKSITNALQSTQIALDTYDDIFSDFDPSPYETRILSDDFLLELKRRYAETKNGDLIVNFTLPANLRSEKIETLIKRRIRDYFKIRLAKSKKDQIGIRNKGLTRIIIGIIALSPVLYFGAALSFALDSMFSVISWYFLWSGLDNLLEIPYKIKDDRSFSEKFYKAKYVFISEDEIVKTITASSGHSYG